MQLKAEILDEMALNRAVTRISHEIVEKNAGVDNIILVGIRTRGVPIAKMIEKNIERSYNVTLPVGILDISLYRDDIDGAGDLDKGSINLPYDVAGKNIVLVDDVLFTGRTVRAAIEAIISLGRPKSIQLAVVIDRGHRELPIRADYVGKNVPTSLSEIISVNVREVDGKENVLLYDVSC